MAQWCCLVGMCLGGTTVALFRVRDNRPVERPAGIADDDA
jgi:hypothetical protein